MSRLPNAPLIEVIFEMKWNITNREDLVKFQYLHGDMYSALKKDFPVRENLYPADLPLDAIKGLAAYRFRAKPEGYPLFQLGPGLLSYNVNDENYYWADYLAQIKTLYNTFSETYPDSKNLKFAPHISYIDFFDVDFTSRSPMNFVNDNFNLTFDQNFIDSKFSDKEININVSHEVNNMMLSYSIRNASVNKSRHGIMLQTKLFGKQSAYNLKTLEEWLIEAHEISRSIFKKIITKEFYKTFH